MFSALTEIYSSVFTEHSLYYVSAISCLITLFIVLSFSRHQGKAQRRYQAELEQVEKRLQIVSSASLGMGEKILQLEARLAENLNSRYVAAENEAQMSYTQALKLIESGVDHSLVSSNSGLSDSEINLMELVHKTRNQTFERASGREHRQVEATER